jgi:hypothetical protein
LNARKISDTIIATGAAPVLKAAGFTKQDLNFHRRQGSVVQVMNFQRSIDNRGGDNVFFVNVGIAFDDLWKLQGIDLHGSMRKHLEAPLEHECHFRSRLENLVVNCPRWWVVSETNASLFRETSQSHGREIATTAEEATRVAEFLADCVERAVIELNQIDSSKSFLAHHWKDVPGNQGMTQQLISINE